jgi:endoglucanase
VILTACAGAIQAQIQINMPTNNAGWSAGQGTPPFSFVTDAPAGGPSTGSVLWGNGTALFQQLYFSTSAGGLGASINATAYNYLQMDVKIVLGGGVGSFQVVLQSQANGWMPWSSSPALADTGGWQHFIIPASAGIAGGNKAVNWANIYSIGVGMWNTTTTHQMEIANIAFTTDSNAPPPYLPPFKEVRTASDTVLVAFFKSRNFSGPAWSTVIQTDEVNTSDLSAWKLNGQPVTAINKFVTEADAVDYHIYLQVPKLTNGMAYTLETPYGNTNFVFDDKQVFCESIKVNQSGYSALSQVRYANLAIWLGNGGAKQISGSLPSYTVFKQFTGEQVASGTLQQIGTGQDTSSGDYVYRMDLSGVPEGGPYKVSVSGYGCSYPFGVGGDFSRRLGYVAFRAMYYQRCGCPIVQPYAWANIRPYGCHTNVYDTQAAESEASVVVNTSTDPLLNVHGGYHDAGDADRRVYHLMVPLVLMTTYEMFPNLFSDDQFNIPDIFDANYNIIGKGNGVPDILDEAVWGTMFWTNVQSTSKEPAGAVAWGSNTSGYPDFGINYDEDTKLWGTEIGDVNSSGFAAGLFMNLARLIKPYDAVNSASLQARADAAYAAAGSGIKTTHKLYYNIQKYLLTGDLTASNLVNSLAANASALSSSYNEEAGGYATDGNMWLANYIMSYIIETNRPTNPTVVQQFKTYLKAAADLEIGYVNSTAYPVGWPANINPQTQYNFGQGGLTPQGQFAYPCLMQWALTKEQKYIDAVSQLMDYDQGLNPIGKCYMTGIGFERVHNPHDRESLYAHDMGFGGPQPGITVYGPLIGGSGTQIPALSGLGRERQYVDHLGTFSMDEFTVYQSEVFPAAIYPVLAQGGKWTPAVEPFLNPAVSINSVGNGWALKFGGIPGQSYVLQAAPAVTGPWTDLSGSVQPDASGMVQFTDSSTPAPATRFYRSRGQAPIY